MYNDETFLYERHQNRQLRIEKLKLITNDFSNDNNYYYKNITPPSSSNNLIKNYINISKETDDYIDYIPTPCPICFDPIWRDTNVITCFYCDKNICLKCYITIDEQCANNNNKLLCPLCRGLFIDYTTETDEENQLSRPARINRSRNRERIIVPINEEEILTVYFGSISFPDHFFNVFITLSLVFF